MNYGILYPTADDNNLLVFTDADWAGEIEKEINFRDSIQTRSSPIAWTSKIQSTLGLSSTEAEYWILSEAERKITYFCRLLQELQVQTPRPTPLLYDNLSSIKLVTQSCIKGRSTSSSTITTFGKNLKKCGGELHPDMLSTSRSVY